MNYKAMIGANMQTDKAISKDMVEQMAVKAIILDMIRVVMLVESNKNKNEYKKMLKLEFPIKPYRKNIEDLTYMLFPVIQKVIKILARTDEKEIGVAFKIAANDKRIIAELAKWNDEV